ncbi:MAG: D-alanine--D-alanine ligase [Anaerolineales bacterium]|nr:MAG: D-alanine--D-alanine ligase [Anaerolineales bacterium]
MKRRIRVGVVFGGRSGEHEVSLASARSVMDAIDKKKYEVVPIGITKEGRWLASGDPMKALESGDLSASGPAALLGDPSRSGLMRLEETKGSVEAARMGELDVVFPVLHGPYGEDGTVQGLLELAGVPYVGAGVVGSAVGMDKGIFKDVMLAHSLPVCDYVLVNRRDWEADPDGVIERIEAELDYPMFTKPANLGSSVGISKCHDREGLVEGMADAARYDRRLIVEVAVAEAREIELSVLGNEDPIVSVPGEIVPSREFYSYESKYVDSGDQASGLLIPAPISAELTETVRRMAAQAYKAIDCAGMARADFLLSGKSGELYVNELNTIPGFTSISMYPKLWAATGISYPELIDRLIDLAIERGDDKSRSLTSYQPPKD